MEERAYSIAAAPAGEPLAGGYDHARISFVEVDTKDEVVAKNDYVLSRHTVQELAPYIDELFEGGIPVEGFLDSNDFSQQHYFYYLNAESFGLVVRLDKEGRDAANLAFTQESLDRFVKTVTEEGLKAGKAVLGCETPVTLALMMANVLGHEPLCSRVANQLMALATTDEYLRMSTPADVELVSRFNHGLYGQNPVEAVFMHNIGRNNFVYLKELRGLNGKLMGLSWSPNGLLMAGAGFGCRDVFVWNAENGAFVAAYCGHTDDIKCVTWSPDGNSLASGGYDNAIFVRTSNRIKKFEGHTACVCALAWSPDGKWLASGSADNTIRIWNVDASRCVHQLTDHIGHVSALAWSPSGNFLASASCDTTVRIWDVATWECVHTLVGHTGHVRSVTWWQDDDHVVSAATDQTIRAWRVSTDACVHMYMGEEVEPVLKRYALSPDGKNIAKYAHSADVVGIYGLASELRELDSVGQWQLLVEHARRPYTDYRAIVAAAHAVRHHKPMVMPSEKDAVFNVIHTKAALVPVAHDKEPWRQFLLLMFKTPLEGSFGAAGSSQPAYYLQPVRISAAQHAEERAVAVIEELMRHHSCWQEVDQYYQQHERELIGHKDLVGRVRQYVDESYLESKGEDCPKDNFAALELQDMLTRRESWQAVQTHLEAYQEELSDYFDLVMQASQYIDERRTGASSSGQ
jgi:hypothetical protein